MINKTKTKYKRIELRLGNFVCVEQRGNKITVEDLVFYANKDFEVTEASTGLRVPLVEESNEDKTKTLTLEKIEEHLIKSYDKIKNAVDEFLKNKPDFNLNDFNVVKE